jgi:DNA replication and repair protein RecF
MHLQRLSLTNFRNYARLELTLPVGISVVQGQNAQGKSNLLEAIAYLATSRSPRTSSDSELLNWAALADPYPYVRLAAELQRRERTEMLDITLLPGKGNGRFRKQVRINGVNKRALDMVGVLLVVLFRPEDVDLVSGSPSLRRRYLDVALCQMKPAYCRALSQYNKTLSQRNALLRALRENPQNASAQLRYWDEKLVETGSLVMAERQWFIREIEREASLRHLDLSGGYERLAIRYLPSFDPGHQPEHDRASYPSTNSLRERGVSYGDLSPAQVRASFLAHLHAGRARDLAAGMSLLGPHRDDLGFYLGNRNLRNFGSRGQQRTAALASKMAELTTMTAVSGDSPILLLDDVMSELDAMRRGMVMETLLSAPQVIITTTDWERFDDAFLIAAHTLHVHGGQLAAVNPCQASQTDNQHPVP